jgi:hypothetical protein
MNRVGHVLELPPTSDAWECQLDKTRICVDLVGEFDAYDLEPLCEVLDGLLSLKETAYVDLSGVIFLDLKCARELAIRSHLCGGRLTLHNLSWQTVSSLRACGYGTPIAPSTSDDYSAYPDTRWPRIEPHETGRS